jgi:hypothetical protein
LEELPEVVVVKSDVVAAETAGPQTEATHPWKGLKSPAEKLIRRDDLSYRTNTKNGRDSSTPWPRGQKAAEEKTRPLRSE